MNLGIVVLEYAWAIREEKIHWWDNLVIQYIQELCWLAVPRPDQLKQPQIITLQFADHTHVQRACEALFSILSLQSAWISTTSQSDAKSSTGRFCSTQNSHDYGYCIKVKHNITSPAVQGKHTFAPHTSKIRNKTVHVSDTVLNYFKYKCKNIKYKIG